MPKYSTSHVFISKAQSTHGDKYDYSKVEYINSITKVCIICPEHGEFYQSPHCHSTRNQGCPMCNSSHGERDVHRWLTDNNIDHDVEYSYPDLVGVNGGLLRFDFYLPDTNTCIEFDGIQHFEHRVGWVTYQEFLEIHEHDRRKNEYCDKHNIHLIRIHYDDYINNVLSINNF